MNIQSKIPYYLIKPQSGNTLVAVKQKKTLKLRKSARKLFKKRKLLVNQIKAIKAALEFIRGKEIPNITFNRFIGFSNAVL